mmetsp:Transcript_29911/g.47717  ORF Transcript_29911/g.47717 Transcript_29911/m.47717 type:complete len:176 (-) Transcript_29911:99-626(-)
MQKLMQKGGYSGGYGCDICGGDEDDRPSYHCSRCQYDVCPDCFSESASVSSSGGKAKANVTCPGKHGLNAFKKAQIGYGCDICGQLFQARSKMHGCRTCNYHVCDNCYGGKKSKKKKKREESDSESEEDEEEDDSEDEEEEEEESSEDDDDELTGTEESSEEDDDDEESEEEESD